MLKTDQYYELDQDIIDKFKDIEKEFALSLDFKYVFQANTKQKCLILIKKLPDNLAVLLKSELIVTVNEKYFDLMDDEIIQILFEQEIDKIHPNMEKGTIKLVQPSLKTTSGMVKKYTYEGIERAYETEKLLVESKNEEE